MTENVCETCFYYEKCKKPKRTIKCLGYKSRFEQITKELDTDNKVLQKRENKFDEEVTD